MTAPTCRTSAEAEAHEAVAVTDVPAGILCLAHRQPCHRNRKRNRRSAHRASSFVTLRRQWRTQDAPACRPSPIP